MSLFDVLQQAMGASTQQAEQHFDKAVQHATPAQLGQGMSQVLRGPETPPFDQMVSQLFGSSNNVQQAGILNQILRAAGPAMAAAAATGALSKVFAQGRTQVTPAEAAAVTPAQVQEIAKQAATAQPGVIDQLGDFYAQHPGLIKTLGGAAMLVLLSKMKDGMRQP